MDPEFAVAATESGLSPPILRAVAEIKKQYGDTVSVTEKSKSLRKFGLNLDIDNTGYKVVWAGNEINDEDPLFGDPSLGNTLDTVVSEGGSDTQTLTIEGHTKSGDDLTFVTQDVTLTGQTEVPLSTPLHVCTRIFNTGTTELTGPVYVFDNADGSALGVPTDPTDVGGYLAGSASITGQQTEQAFTAISSQDYYIVTAITAAVNRQTSASVDFIFQTRTTTSVWRPLGVEIALATTGTNTVRFNLDPDIVIPKNSYIRVIARGSSASATAVSFNFSGYLASVT